MDLKLIPSNKNKYSLKGLLVKGKHPEIWMTEMNALGINLNQSVVFPIPGPVPNSIWGCFIEEYESNRNADFRLNQRTQMIADVLFIPEKTDLFPAFEMDEIKALCKKEKYIWHPEFGLYKLVDTVDWNVLIHTPIMQECEVQKPEPPIHIPTKIKSFQVISMSPEEFSKREKFIHRPNNLKSVDSPPLTDEFGSSGIAYFNASSGLFFNMSKSLSTSS